MSDTRSKLSSGTVLYRYVDGAIEVLLVHPAGNYNRRAPWGIPKGAPDPDEGLEQTALRETLEETGLAVAGPLVDLGHVDYTRSKKRVHGFAAPAPEGAAPRCASWEVDKAEFIEITRARRIIHPDQAVLLDRLQRHLAMSSADVAGEASVPVADPGHLPVELAEKTPA
ncbi:MAG: NUDIX domain-containing protein [Deltaproteobacteria bacterium]|nr:NUDIX domain-containing protein [Deltaproteobacteria bacterium]MDQ3298959.1 NUDIX domain-containing protein [Myxococcota bacterium]